MALSTLFSAFRRLFSWRTHVARLFPNWRSVVLFPPGHFYSPLVDISDFAADPERYTRIAESHWTGMGLDKILHDNLHTEFLQLCGEARVPSNRRYTPDNCYFYYADAFTASGMILKFRPRRIVEVGSGFSSAAMLDVCEDAGLQTSFDFIDPYPERLDMLLSPGDKARHVVHHKPVQNVPTELFATLEAGDFLFVDSSHVLKVGSDIEDIFLRILPVIKPGVIVHFHDVFYPSPYPVSWIESGRAWNEALVVQILLRHSPHFETLFFNSFFAAKAEVELRISNPRFLEGIPASLWLRCRTP